MRHTIDMYESFLQRALASTFKHPRMILLGILVAAVNTGSVFFHMYQFTTIIAPFSNVPLDVFSTLPAFAWIGISNTFTSTSILAIGATVILSIFLFLAGVTAQKWLIQQAHSSKKINTRLSKASFGLNSAWMHLLYVNVLYIIGITFAFAGGGSLLEAIPQTFPTAYTLISITIYIILTLFIFFWNVITMLSLIHIIENGMSTHDALQEAFTHVTKFPLRIAEVSILQLAIELLFGLIGVAIITCATFATSVLIALLSGTGSPFLLQGGFIFISATIILFILLFAGLITSFSYHLWTEYHKGQHHLEIKSVIVHIVSGIKSMFSR